MDYIIPSLRNACRILAHIGKDGRALSCLDVARAMKLPRTSVLRMMETLASESFLTKEDGKYSLGGMLANLGDCTLSRVNLLSIVEKYLRKLTDITGETAHFGVPSDHKVLIARVCESPLPLHAASREGAVVDAYCSGTGKVILSYLYKKDSSILKKIKLEQRTRNTINSKIALQKELNLIAKQGYAIDDEEYHEGVRCIAVPVFDKIGAMVGGLGITAPAGRFTRARVPEMYQQVKLVADEIGKRLGARI